MKRTEGDPLYKFKPRTNNLRHLLDDSVLDDETRKELMRDVMDIPRSRAPPLNQPPAASQAKGTRKDVPSPHEELLTVMTQRLHVLERQSSVLQKELKEKNMKVIELEDKLRATKTDRDTAIEERNQYALQIEEMLRFLRDYGLEWVGDNGTSTDAHVPGSSETRIPTHPPTFDIYSGAFKPPAAQEQPAPTVGTGGGCPTTLPFDLHKLKRNAEVLSAHVGSSTLLSDGQKRVIKEREVVHVCVYSDGICVNSGPFRPYGWPLANAVIDDVLEGFYPYEFKDRYPDGFPIHILDKSTEKCPTGLVPTTGVSNIVSASDQPNFGYKPLTREAFLKKLPDQYVTANGYLVNVRSGVSEFIGGTASPIKPAQSTVTPRGSASDVVKANPSCENVTAVQVRLPNGQKVVLHMYFEDTVAQLKEELREAVPGFDIEFELCSAFPRKTYDDYSATLASLGLVPNCNLMVKRCDI
jgi:hypothetical protein